MKKQGKKLFGLLMVLTLVMGVLFSVKTAEAAAQSATRYISVYDNAEYAGSIKVTIRYNSNGTSANITSCTIDNISYSGGYVIKNVNYSVTNGTSAKCKVTYDLYLRSTKIRSGSYTITVRNNGSVS